MNTIVGAKEGTKHAASNAKPFAVPQSLEKLSVTPPSLQIPFGALPSLQDLIKQRNHWSDPVSSPGKISSDDGRVAAENKGEWHDLLIYLRPTSFLVIYWNYSYTMLDIEISIIHIYMYYLFHCLWYWLWNRV